MVPQRGIYLIFLTLLFLFSTVSRRLFPLRPEARLHHHVDDPIPRDSSRDRRFCHPRAVWLRQEEGHVAAALYRYRYDACSIFLCCLSDCFFNVFFAFKPF